MRGGSAVGDELGGGVGAGSHGVTTGETAFQGGGDIPWGITDEGGGSGGGGEFFQRVGGELGLGF